MRLAPPGETGDTKVLLKDVLNVKKGLWPGYPQKPKRKSVAARRKLSLKCSGRVPWNKGRRASETARKNMSRAQKEGDWHQPHIEMALTGPAKDLGSASARSGE